MIHEPLPDAHQDSYSKTVFGFWVYLLTDFMMFATLFATYLVLRTGTGVEVLDKPWVLQQTLVLLTCSFVVGLGGAMAHRRNRGWTLILFGLTFVLGAVFLWMEWVDLHRMVKAGHGWQENGLMSAFFSVVGTHAVHVVLALLWTLILLGMVVWDGIDFVSLRRLTCLRMFWQFLNVVWVFIFSIVYLLGDHAGH